MAAKKWVLENYKECGFDFRPLVETHNDITFESFVDNYMYGSYNGLHSSLSAAKKYIRDELAVKGKTPRFKWVKHKL